MDKLKAIIVEDEKRGMDKIVAMLEDFCPNISIVEKCFDGKTAIKAITNERPDLVFLDIELGGTHGFDVLASVNHLSFETIITTAHQEYGIKAVKAGAIDYLIKPFTLTELQEAVQKAWTKIQANTTSNKTISKISLPDTHGVILISVSDIIYCEADNNCSNIYLKSENKPLFIVKTLGKIYEKLPQEQFCRISRSYIVNMNDVASYSRLDGGSINLTNGKVLNVRPGKFRDNFLLRLSLYN